MDREAVGRLVVVTGEREELRLAEMERRPRGDGDGRTWRPRPWCTLARGKGLGRLAEMWGSYWTTPEEERRLELVGTKEELRRPRQTPGKEEGAEDSGGKMRQGRDL